MTAADLVFEQEGKIHVLYAWNGSYWVRAGEISWQSYWWCAYFLDRTEFGQYIAKGGGPEDLKRALMKYAVEHIDEIKAYRRPVATAPTRWNQLEIDKP